MQGERENEKKHFFQRSILQGSSALTEYFEDVFCEFIRKIKGHFPRTRSVSGDTSYMKISSASWRTAFITPETGECSR